MYESKIGEPYTVEGEIIGKVFEPAHSEQSMILAGRVVAPITNQVGDRWYVEIGFTDNNSQYKTFYLGVTKEAYDKCKVGDKTPVNVEDTSGAKLLFVYVLLGGGVAFGIIKLSRWGYRTRIRAANAYRERIKREEALSDEILVMKVEGNKVKLSIFGIPIIRRRQ